MSRIVHLTSVHVAWDNRIFDRECKSLASQGHEVTLIVPHEQDEIRENVQIRAVAKAPSRGQRLLKVVPAIYKAAIQENADLYQFHDPELIPVGLMLRRKGKNVIYDVHEDYPSTIRHSAWLPRGLKKLTSKCFARFERGASKQFSGLIGANYEITSRISELNPLTVNIGNYPNIADFPRAPSFDPARFAAGKLVHFGGVSSRTCTRVVIEAIGLLPHNMGATLRLGGGVSSQALLKQVSGLPGWHRVSFQNLRLDEMLSALLSASIGLVLFSPEPNHYGVGSNRFYEALAAGLPVITSDFPNWKKLVNSIGCGIAVDSTSPQAVADAISFLLTHPDEAAEMGRRGYEMALNEFNWEKESRKLHQFYSNILGPEESLAEVEPKLAPVCKLRTAS
ncbi:MAG: glycosyl transferase group 1 [Acidobacteriales bacterium]|nr:glycosyl transferase group 1 [Terriglobales bacterium]